MGGRGGEREGGREGLREEGTVNMHTILHAFPYHSTLSEPHSNSFLWSWNKTLSLSFLISSVSHCMALTSSSRSSLQDIYSTTSNGASAYISPQGTAKVIRGPKCLLQLATTISYRL